VVTKTVDGTKMRETGTIYLLTLTKEYLIRKSLEEAIKYIQLWQNLSKHDLINSVNLIITK
jgi:hypothetical protein